MADHRFKWDAHVCLPISVATDVRDLLAYRRAGAITSTTIVPNPRP